MKGKEFLYQTDIVDFQFTAIQAHNNSRLKKQALHYILHLKLFLFQILLFLNVSKTQMGLNILPKTLKNLFACG